MQKEKVSLFGVEFRQCIGMPDDMIVMISPLSDDEVRVLETKSIIWDLDSMLRWMVENKRIVVVKNWGE